MPTHKVFYFSHAPENVYAIIREEVPPGLELVTLDQDSDDERKRKIADCEVVIVAPVSSVGLDPSALALFQMRMRKMPSCVDVVRVSPST